MILIKVDSKQLHHVFKSDLYYIHATTCPTPLYHGLCLEINKFNALLVGMHTTGTFSQLAV